MNNPLRYDINRKRKFGRKARQCLECKERELYIEECSKAGETTVGLRQKNRYIDEFLVFVHINFKVTSISGLEPIHIKSYEDMINADNFFKETTKKNKINRARQFLKWLHSRSLTHDISPTD